MENDPLQPVVRKAGRPKGVVNRSTATARKAIAEFVNGSAPHLVEWLTSLAYGIPATDEAGKVLRDNQGAVRWVNRPDPGAAIKAVADLAEYHLPRLTRSEASVVAKVEQTGPFDPATMSTEELQRFIAAKLLNYDQGSVIDVEHERVEPLPAWMQQDGPKP